MTNEEHEEEYELCIPNFLGLGSLYKKIDKEPEDEDPNKDSE